MSLLVDNLTSYSNEACAVALSVALLQLNKTLSGATLAMIAPPPPGIGAVPSVVVATPPVAVPPPPPPTDACCNGCGYVYGLSPGRGVPTQKSRSCWS